jgi:hypothetical protein
MPRPRLQLAATALQEKFQLPITARNCDFLGNHAGTMPVFVRECCLLVLNLVSSTLPCIRQPRPRLRVLDVCGFV